MGTARKLETYVWIPKMTLKEILETLPSDKQFFLGRFGRAPLTVKEILSNLEADAPKTLECDACTVESGKRLFIHRCYGVDVGDLIYRSVE